MPEAPGGDHFYTTSASERDRAALDGYRDEGIACYVFDSPTPEAMPLYRLYSPKVYKHLYTTSADERTRSVTHNGYRDEGIACYVFDSPAPGAIPLYRMFHRPSSDHLYTTSARERDYSATYEPFKYRDEGIAGYVFDSPTPGAIPFYRLYKI